MKKQERLLSAVSLCLTVLIANCFALLYRYPWLTAAAVPLFLLACCLPYLSAKGVPSKRLRICLHGVTCLRIFRVSAVLSVLYQTAAAFLCFPEHPWRWAAGAAVCILAEAAYFWNGILCVYASSVQLGLRERAVGILCGWIPIANLIALGRIIRICSAEVSFEREKYALDCRRQAQQICKTKYPLLLVHGVFFRDSKYLNYWGRIPEALAANGAVIYYGNHQSAASVADSAAELTDRIKAIVSEAGCEKVNIIAHSKGGLDCRRAIHSCGAAAYVASLTTINTPHRGCKFADYLLDLVPQKTKDAAANTYNAALRKLGDQNPDFLSAVTDLTSQSCLRQDAEMPLPENIFCQSVGSKLNRATNGKFPLNFTFHLVKYFDGANDGLVGEDSFRWGEKYTFLTTPGSRGISHGDMIDLNRENIPGFDVREFYVQLVSAFRRRGL